MESRWLRSGLTALVLLAGCGELSENQRTKVALGVYAGVLETDAPEFWDCPSYLVIDEAFDGASDFESSQDPDLVVERFLTGSHESTRTDFFEQSKIPGAIPAELSSPRLDRLAGWDETCSFLDDTCVAQGVCGLVRLSRIGVSHNGRQAIVCASVTYGFLGANGWCSLWERRSGQWRRIHLHPTWIS